MPRRIHIKRQMTGELFRSGQHTLRLVAGLDGWYEQRHSANEHAVSAHLRLRPQAIMLHTDNQTAQRISIANRGRIARWAILLGMLLAPLVSWSITRVFRRRTKIEV